MSCHQPQLYFGVVSLLCQTWPTYFHYCNTYAETEWHTAHRKLRGRHWSSTQLDMLRGSMKQGMQGWVDLLDPASWHTPRKWWKDSISAVEIRTVENAAPYLPQLGHRDGGGSAIASCLGHPSPVITQPDLRCVCVPICNIYQQACSLALQQRQPNHPRLLNPLCVIHTQTQQQCCSVSLYRASKVPPCSCPCLSLRHNLCVRNQSLLQDICLAEWLL